MSSNIWFTSDTHFGHARIIQYSNRPFQNHEEMDEAMITRFNEVIKPGDILYHLGDVAWSNYDLSKFFGRLNSRSVHLILGNHDKANRFKGIKQIVWMGDLKSVNIGTTDRTDNIQLCHYSMRTWNYKSHGSMHLYGHSHGNLPGVDRSMDVGVDTHNFYPYEWSEIKERMKDIPAYQDIKHT